MLHSIFNDIRWTASEKNVKKHVSKLLALHCSLWKSSGTYASYTKTNNRQKTTFRVSLVTFQTKLIIGCQYILNGDSIDALLVLFKMNTRYIQGVQFQTQLVNNNAIKWEETHRNCISMELSSSKLQPTWKCSEKYRQQLPIVKDQSLYKKF